MSILLFGIIQSFFSFTPYNNFQVGFEDLLKPGKVEGIVDALSRNDFNDATRIWESIKYPANDTSNHLFKNHWFTEILHNSFQNSSNIISVIQNVGQFIHTSTKMEDKAHFYSQVLNEMANFNNQSKSALFSVGQFMVKDNVRKELVSVYDFQFGSQPNVRFEQLLDPLIWSVLDGKNVLLQNAKYNSYLYVGEVQGQKQMLLWKGVQFINKYQAYFYFSSNTNNPNQFQLMHKQGSQVINVTDTLMLKSEKSIKSKNIFWDIQIRDEGISLAIVNSDTRNKKYLCSREPKLDLDDLRGRVILLEEDLIKECFWKLQTA